VPGSVESQCYCFSQASQAEFCKLGRILQAKTSALAVGRGLEPSKIRFLNSRMPILTPGARRCLTFARYFQYPLQEIRLYTTS
jgi:hypothetical protein